LQQAVEPAQLQKLLATGKTDLLPRFISKRGRPFKAFLVLEKSGKVGFEFEPRAPKASDSKKAEPVERIDFSGQTSLGACPKCGGNMYQSETHYLCENTQAEGKRCTFKLEKVRCERPVPVEQLQKLLRDKKTDLLEFISRRGKPFKAWLTLKGKGKIEFEFPETNEESSPAAAGFETGTR